MPRSAGPGRGVVGATRGDVAVDAPEFETREIGLAQVAAIGRCLTGFASEACLKAIEERPELALIAHAWRKGVRHDNLRLSNSSAFAIG
jgi:hypothetical protein